MKKRRIISWNFLIPLFLFACLSIITIYSAQTLLPSYMQNLALKQGMWYLLGFLFIYFFQKLNLEKLYSYAWIFYFIGLLLLFLLLPFGTEINDAKCWFQIPGIGSFQPSEFMKIALIIILSMMVQKFHQEHLEPTIKEEFKFLLKIGFVVGIPSFLTFLEPDTGVVLIYLLITIVILFVAAIRYRWFALLIGLTTVLIATVLLFYFFQKDLFIDIFGTSFFLRVDRLLNWSTQSGFQLENGMSAIGSGGLFGNGFLKTPIYFPEPQTDFIFAVYASNFGYLGSLLLLGTILYFDLQIIRLAKRISAIKYKVFLAGAIGMLLYQQLQNIGMTFGLMPITGITLPFISYGGSSLMSYMIIAAFILKLDQLHHKNQI